MPFPSPGALYCSKACRLGARSAQRSARRLEAQTKLAAYKLQRGCEECGYRGCAAALHFHHRDPDLKTMRITALQFAAATERTAAELAKCRLLCANCHFEAHHLAS